MGGLFSSEQPNTQYETGSIWNSDPLRRAEQIEAVLKIEEARRAAEARQRISEARQRIAEAARIAESRRVRDRNVNTVSISRPIRVDVRRAGLYDTYSTHTTPRPQSSAVSTQLTGRRIEADKYDIIEIVLRNRETQHWFPGDYKTDPVGIFELSNASPEYQRINRLFRGTNQKRFKVTNIEQIQNPYLMCAFLLKREEMAQRFGYEPQIYELFHGTKRAAVDSICRENFDWRMHGQNKGHKFGKGVSFTPISNYATHYSDEVNVGRVMFLVKVLVGQCCVGSEGMPFPPENCDTSQKENGQVYVKYEDDEFYPAYKITYDCTYVSKQPRNKRQTYYQYVAQNYCD